MGLLNCDECNYMAECDTIKINEDTIGNYIRATPGKISDILNEDKLVMYACKLGDILKKDLKSTQLRRFYDAVRKVEETIKRENDNTSLSPIVKSKIILLKPQLANASAKKEALKPLFVVMEQCLDIKKYDTVRDARTLINFFQSIVAYHKAWDEK